MAGPGRHRRFAARQSGGPLLSRLLRATAICRCTSSAASTCCARGYGRRTAMPAACAALVGVASHALLRVSEVSGLDVEDLAFQRDGSALVSIRRSKTDQYGEGAVLHVCRDAVGRLKRWMAMAGIESGPLFRPVKGARSRRRVSDPAPSERRSSAGRRRPASPGGSRAIRYASAPPSRWPSAACRWRSCR